MSAGKDIWWRVYIVYIVMCLFGVVILFNVFKIQFYEGDQWQQKGRELTTALKTIPAVRGNIYAADGSLLATSVPKYEIRMDMVAEAITEDLFMENVSPLADSLAILFDSKSANTFKRDLIAARRDSSRYYLVKREVSYNQLQRLKKFPLFNRGRYKGGFIYEQYSKRERPFRVLAARTIGYDRENAKPVGLEGAYSVELKGVDGLQLKKRMAGGHWKPVRDGNEIEPQDGCDLYTTIDINIQDVAESALLKQLQENNADHGCVVLMEVETGYIKAIANLKRSENGNYYEYYNYAIGESTEPGSTFKLASLVVALDHGMVDITDSVDAGNGVAYYSAERIPMHDSKRGGHGKITIKRALEVSSNIGISKIIYDNYNQDRQAFVDKLYDMNLHQPLGLEIAGEGMPMIKTPEGDGHWSGITLTQMSIGYELRMTTMQVLCFYNAIANNGKMVKPLFVKEIKKGGRLIRSIDPEVINPKICSQETIDKVKECLEGVVENGTGKNLKGASFKIAGKTGTARIANDKYGYEYGDKEYSYQASFVGYFPADKPKYSCIVVVNAPSKDKYYGSAISGPIFKEIADKVYANSIEIHESVEVSEDSTIKYVPYSKNGNQKDLQRIFTELHIPTNAKSPDSKWVVTVTKESEVDLEHRKVDEKQIPNVLGMGAQDALHILENMGLRVQIKGSGIIKTQSLQAGAAYKKGDRIVLELS